MNLEKILSISGKPGLYKLTTQTRAGFLAESLLDGKRISVGGRHNVSLLSEIAIYTLTEEVPLREVFAKISEKEDGGEAINHKVPKIELEEYFFSVLPDYDEDRVYASDIKKVIQWYNLLVKNGYTDFSEETAATDKNSEEASEENEEKEGKTKAVKKAPAKGKVKPAAKTATPKATSAKKGGAAKNTSARKK
ncbi:DUF5606 family protein [Cochleicola gelatinilyticus]|uniref:Uncharacterized protein n=1 Tax=Cochleicola gelatinilyticus TaxID=1763537 RepID=A0A167HDE4_9FLAO|nr:hypothetical protein ULVI_07860 [Cochleicola gelatinilyticus]